MAPLVQEKIQIIVDKITTAFKPEKIILFGSYAWGTPSKESDVDLLIIKSSPVPAHHRITEVERVVYPAPMPLDVLVYTPQEFQQRLDLGDFFITRILNEGKMLYAGT